MSDIDSQETKEWLEALEAVLESDGAERVQFLLNSLAARAKTMGANVSGGGVTSYINSIPPEQEEKMPEDDKMLKRILSILRWNAAAMVVRAGKKDSSLGGHIATYASAAVLYEVGFNYFFRGRTDDFPGDLLYIQGHSSPGIYARGFLEGRLSEQQLERFRQEVGGKGISSYPHPWLMKDFWQFPTVSMGLGPLQAIYQARFLKYLQNRKLIDNKGRKVWAFLGDGEMDEPESLGAITIATREKLDNLIFVINCNLQRLDGPVRGNGKIINELEGVFRGAGWNVIKVLWGARWDPLFEKDTSGLLIKRMDECLDGEYQNFKSKDGAYVREYFFGKYPELLELVKDMSDEEIWALNRGGHDPKKVYAAYAAAMKHTDTPTVILAQTVKGYGLGSAGESANPAHNVKKMSGDDLTAFCERFKLPIPKEKIKDAPFYKPEKNSDEIKFIQDKREKLGGYLPARFEESPKLNIPALDTFKLQLQSTGDREISTTMVFVQILSALLRNKEIRDYIVPIVPDECRTFGMEGLFRQIGIYSLVGQLYEPMDKSQMMYYKEAKNGQLLEEGITEAGGFCSWIAAATSYATNGLPMIPFYIYYSMFGFQRVGDLAWAAGDLRARGFLLGGTAGRTTLAGEGLQHDDGQSHVQASVVPTCVTYDPTYAYELAVIIHHGLKRMLEDQEDVYFYLTVMNENYKHPEMPKGVEDGIIKGLYCLQKASDNNKLTVQLLGSGAILREVIAASELLKKDFGVSANIWSATSFNELRRDALQVERENHLNPDKKPKLAYVTECLKDEKGPVIAATDYMRVYADQIRFVVPLPYYVLGTDGFGRSDTRPQLRHFFEVDAKHIAYTAIKALADEKLLPVTKVKEAIKKWSIDAKKPNPMCS